MGAALLLAAALLPSCAEVSRRVGSFTGGVPALAAADGWAELPVGRWLQESGVTVTAVSFCRPETCAQPGFAARLTLEGRERIAIRRIVEAPETLAARPTARSARDAAARRPSGPTEVTRLAMQGWAGALFALRPSTSRGAEAHVVILAQPGSSAAMIAAAPGREGALAIASAAIWW